MGLKYPDSMELRDQGSLGNGVHKCQPAKIPRTEWTWELWCCDGDQPAALFGQPKKGYYQKSGELEIPVLQNSAKSLHEKWYCVTLVVCFKHGNDTGSFGHCYSELALSACFCLVFKSLLNPLS